MNNIIFWLKSDHFERYALIGSVHQEVIYDIIDVLSQLTLDKSSPAHAIGENSNLSKSKIGQLHSVTFF